MAWNRQKIDKIGWILQDEKKLFTSVLANVKRVAALIITINLSEAHVTRDNIGPANWAIGVQRAIK